MNYVKGLDVSAMQGIVPPNVWRQLYDSGCRFVYHRAVVGNDSGVDGVLARNFAASKDAGLLAGVYCFTYPLPWIAPVDQCMAWISKLEKARVLHTWDLPPMNDFEWPARWRYEVKDGVRTLVDDWSTKWKGVSPLQLRNYACEQQEILARSTGLKWVLYGYPDFFTQMEVHLAPDLGKYLLNLANYNVRGRWPTEEEAKRLAFSAKPPWEKATFVQNDGNGGLALPSGVDSDFDIFLGTEDELRGLLETQRTSPPVLDVVFDIVRSSGAILDADIRAYRESRDRSMTE